MRELPQLRRIKLIEKFEEVRRDRCASYGIDLNELLEQNTQTYNSVPQSDQNNDFKQQFQAIKVRQLVNCEIFKYDESKS